MVFFKGIKESGQYLIAFQGFIILFLCIKILVKLILHLLSRKDLKIANNILMLLREKFMLKKYN